MSRWAWAEVDLDAIRAQRRGAACGRAPAAVWANVKADGYGHGAVRGRRAALRGGAAGLCVALVQEGVELRAAGFDCPILVLSEQPPAELAERRRVPGSTSPCTRTRSCDAIAAAGGRDHPGAPQDRHRHAPGRVPAADEAWRSPRRSPTSGAVRLAGVCTHLAVADEPDDPYTAAQIERSTSARGAAVAGHRAPLVHAANSAATLAHPAARFDMVRAGIAIYGISPGPGARRRRRRRCVRRCRCGPGSRT